MRIKEKKSITKESIGMWNETTLKSLKLKAEGRFWEFVYRYKKFDF